MKANNKSFLENLFYNNKFLMVFCVIVSIAVWTTVKINYSADTERTVSDVKIKISSNASENSDFKVFVDESELYAEVSVSGKAYNINSSAFTKDDIIVEATGSYSDSAGYRVLNLSAKLSETSNASDVTITNISPSTITVYFDKEATGTFDVEARLTNDLDSIVDDNFSVGQPVPSVSNVKVSGPATIINNLAKVYFDASVLESDIPLSASKVVPAEIKYGIEKQDFAKYLVCEDINDESNPATVTVPVYVSESVPTQVKFINQPSYYADNPLDVKINPSKIRISYNSGENIEYNSVAVGTIDFRELSNEVMKFSFDVDPSLPVALSESVTKFDVTVDLSMMKRKTVSVNSSKIVLTNQKDGYNYNVDIKESGFDSIVIIGPEESLKKITGEDIQIEINVSSISSNMRRAKTIDISNISIINPDVNDCWVYGNYSASISVSAQDAAE